MKHPNAAVAGLHPQLAGMPVGQGSCVVPVPCGGTRPAWEGGSCVHDVQHKRCVESARGGRPQPHLPSTSPPEVCVASLGRVEKQMMYLIVETYDRQRQKSPSRCTCQRDCL